MLDFATQLAWLLTMAKCPGFKAYAWRRAQDLEAMFPGMALALTNAMKGGDHALDSQGGPGHEDSNDTKGVPG